MKQVITQDGSVTFYSEKFGEHFKSKSGAEEESFKKYAEPCKVKELASSGSVKILDFCFGLGYNSAAALDVALAENPSAAIEIVGLENDDAMLCELASLSPGFQSYSLIKELLAHKTSDGYALTKGNIALRIAVGDAKETCTSLAPAYFDAVFFDPFSPPRSPDLWTLEVFRSMLRVLRPGGVLATYSYARSVRDGLREAGFDVRDGPIVGRRSPSTLAFKPDHHNL